MRFLKNHVLLRIVNSYLVDSPEPANISYLWNFGSLLGLCLVIQILSGAFLAMHYTPHVDFAFNSVEHIMRDVNNGWIIRYVHANVASFFFIFVYSHMGRSLYYGSYRSPRVLLWSTGVIILILMIAIAFLGYEHSPKWFNLSVSYFYLLFIIFISIFFIVIGIEEIAPSSKKINTIKKLKYNKLNKGLYYKNSIGKSVLLLLPGVPPRRLRLRSAGYSTSCSANRSIDISDRLKEIIKELELIPVYIFENLNSENTRKQILNETKGLSGIYMIINKITKDYYIGSASTNRFYSRFCNHLIYFRGSKIVKLAVQKYKLENFSFLILEIYPNVITKENNKELIDLEDKYLKLFLPNYNILTEAGSSFGYKHTEITRQKMIDIYSDDRRKKIGILNRGKTLSKEIIEKIREKALNRPHISNETKHKCIKNTRPIVLYNLNGTIFGEFPTILEAAKAINCNEKTIRRALQTEKKLVKRQWIVKDFSYA